MKLTKFALLIAVLMLLGGCVVVPAGYYHDHPYHDHYYYRGDGYR